MSECTQSDSTCIVEQATIRRLRPGTLDAYRELAKAHGRSLEAELRAVLEAGAAKPVKYPARLLALSDRALARTKKVAEPSDSTEFIREARDHGYGGLGSG